MDPQAMTEALVLQPRHCWRAGEPRSTPKGEPLSEANRESFWTANLDRGNWPPISLAAAIGAALDRLSDRREFLHRLRSEGGSAEFFIGWFFADQSGDMLPHDLLMRAADLAIDLSFDVYSSSPSEGEERDLIPDETTALRVGLAILQAYYGREFVARFEPYRAVLFFGTWSVMGDSPAEKEARREQERLGPSHFVLVYGGGAPHVELRPRDGRVMRISLAR